MSAQGMGNTATATRRHIQTQAMALPLPTAPLQAVDSGALTPARTTAARSVRQTAAPIKRKVQLIRVRSSSETETGPSGALPPPAKVFVAGATGATGQRVVRELLQRGIRVQAGVRNLDKAKSLLADAYAEDLDLVLRTPSLWASPSRPLLLPGCFCVGHIRGPGPGTAHPFT